MLDNYLVFVFPHLQFRPKSLIATCILVSFQPTISTGNCSHPTGVSWGRNFKLSFPPCSLFSACLFFEHRRFNVWSVCVRPEIWTRNRVYNFFVCLQIKWLLEKVIDIVLRMQLLLCHYRYAMTARYTSHVPSLAVTCIPFHVHTILFFFASNLPNCWTSSVSLAILGILLVLF